MGQDAGWAAPGGEGRAQDPPRADGLAPGRTDRGAAPGGSGWGAVPGGPGGAGGPAGGRPWSAAPDPGIVPLRPLGVFEVLEGGFRAIRDNPRVMLGVSALVFLVVAVVDILLNLALAASLGELFDTALSGTAPTAGFSADVGGTNPIGTLVDLVASTVLTGLLVLSVSRSVIGRRTSAAELWARVRGRILPLVGLTVLTGVLLTLVVVVGALPGFLVLLGGSDVGGAVLLVVGVLAAVVVVVWLGVAWSFAPVVLLLEGRGVVASLRRSSALVRGTWWRVLGVLLLVQLLAGIASAVLVVPAVVVATVVTLAVSGSAGGITLVLVSTLAGAVASTLTQPFVAAATALLYTDVRMRREGLDVELARAAWAAAPVGPAGAGS